MEPTTPPGGGRAESVESALVVDDSDLQRTHLASLCRDLGIATIIEARDGAEALDQLRRRAAPPQLVIVDLEMPGMDGIELMERLRAAGLASPVIIASGREHALVESVRDMARTHWGLRVVAALRKPVTRGALQAALRRCARCAPAPRRPPALRIDACMLGAAIGSDQIHVHYQPKADVGSGAVRGVEALARWRHPAFGAVPPDQFVAVAERCGLIEALTLSVMDQAFAQLARWHALGLELSMAVNLSPRLLERPSIGAAITALAGRHGVRAGAVTLEITESGALPDSAAVLGLLTRLRLKGFGLAIDDYGTGYATPQQLARAPFSELKIDRSYVHLAHRRRHLQAILHSAIGMAQQLGMTSVAEGVETADDWDLLREFGCTQGQGWLIATALPGDALPAWLRVHEQRIPGLTASRRRDEDPLTLIGA